MHLVPVGRSLLERTAARAVLHDEPPVRRSARGYTVGHDDIPWSGLLAVGGAIVTRPRVLVTTGHRWLHTPLKRLEAVMGMNYLEALARVGTTPTLAGALPIDRHPDLVGSLLDAVDGVLFSGGADIDPVEYGQAPDAHLGLVDPTRDAFELALYREARNRDLPILGICRGIQLIAVAEGGALHQHLPADPARVQHMQASPEGHPIHRVRLEPGTALGAAFERAGADVPDHVRVNTYHHQGLDGVPDTLRAIAWADDGVIEAVEGREGAFLVGVQWHPEMAFEQHDEQIAPFALFADALGAER